MTIKLEPIVMIKELINLSDPFGSLFIARIKSEREGMCRVHVKCYACGWNAVVSIPRSTLPYDVKKIYDWHKASTHNHLMKLN